MRVMASASRDLAEQTLSASEQMQSLISRLLLAADQEVDLPRPEKGLPEWLFLTVQGRVVSVRLPEIVE